MSPSYCGYHVPALPFFPGEWEEGLSLISPEEDGNDDDVARGKKAKSTVLYYGIPMPRLLYCNAALV